MNTWFIALAEQALNPTPKLVNNKEDIIVSPGANINPPIDVINTRPMQSY